MEWMEKNSFSFTAKDIEGSKGFKAAGSAGSIEPWKLFSISDEILGDEDDLCDVDAVFESLLNNTFDEKSGRHVSRKEKSSSTSELSSAKQARSKSGHPLLQETAESALVASAAMKSERRKSRTSSVTRKPSKSKLVAGEVKAVLRDHQQSGNATLATHVEQRRAGEEAVFKKMADPVAALPTSHTKKYLPRQQTWGAGAGSPTQNLGQAQTHTPSPTLSEYDTCDPWDDY